jgi:hypothetical protein
MALNLHCGHQAALHQRSADLPSTGRPAGLKPHSASCRPRIHDISHGSAVRTILDSYRDGGDPGARLAPLSTYLGHVDPGKTYWYLAACPELLQSAGGRLGASPRKWRMTTLATTLQAFLTDRLIRQRQVVSKMFCKIG